MAVLECVVAPPVKVTQRKGTSHLKGIFSVKAHVCAGGRKWAWWRKGLKVWGLCECGFLCITLRKGSSLFTAIVSHCNSFPSNSHDNRSNSQQQKKVIAMHNFLLFILCQGLFYASVISINVILHKVATLIISIYRWGNQGTETLRAQNHMVRRRTGTQSRLHAGTQEALLSSWALAIALHLLVVKPAPPVCPLSAFYWHPGIRPALGLNSNFGAGSPISILSTSCNQETWFYFFSLRAFDLHR